MKTRIIQVNMRISAAMKAEIEAKRIEFAAKNHVEISFNGYVQHLLKIGLSVESDQK